MQNRLPLVSKPGVCHAAPVWACHRLLLPGRRSCYAGHAADGLQGLAGGFPCCGLMTALRLHGTFGVMPGIRCSVPCYHDDACAQAQYQTDRAHVQTSPACMLQL